VKIVFVFNNFNLSRTKDKSGITFMSTKEKNHQQQQVAVHSCIEPSEINQKDINEVERMLASHTWQINKIDHVEAKIKISYSCVKCDTERFAFVEWIPRA